MNESILFLAFCITIIALVALGNRNDELAKAAVDYLGQLAQRIISPLAKSPREKNLDK